MRAQDSSGNMILGNVVNDTGVVSGFGTAILLSSSTDNVIQGNLIDRQPAQALPFRGISLFDSTRNIVRGNTVQNQSGGGIILFQGALDNLIQANEAVNNTPWISKTTMQAATRMFGERTGLVLQISPAFNKDAG